MPLAPEPPENSAKPLTQVFFVSTATHPASNPGTRDLIEATRRRNPRNNITGVLLRTDRLYIQIAEGSEDDVERLMSAIRRDSRHWDIREWPKRQTTRRAFANWEARRDLQLRAEQLAGEARAQQGNLPFEDLIEKLQHLSDRVEQVQPLGTG